MAVQESVGSIDFDKKPRDLVIQELKVGDRGTFSAGTGRAQVGIVVDQGSQGIDRKIHRFRLSNKHQHNECWEQHSLEDMVGCVTLGIAHVRSRELCEGRVDKREQFSVTRVVAINWNV